MAYNKKYYLMRVKEVCEVFQHYHAKGYAGAWIYRNHIKEQFHISHSTMQRYLGIPYNRELERLRKNETDCNTADTPKKPPKKADFRGKN